MKLLLVQILQILRYLAAKIHTKKSYAQHGEDLKIAELVGGVESFIDIGANDGYSVSNTFKFAVHGAHGICFEPVQSVYKLLKALYRFNSRITCLNFGVSDKATSTEIVAAGVLSYIEDTAEKEHLHILQSHFPKNTRKETIQLARFDEIMKTLKFPKQVDLLSIDVEGHELNVLKSISFNQYKFKVIVIETHTFKNGVELWKHRDLAEIETLLTKNNYKKTAQTEFNSFYQLTTK